MDWRPGNPAAQAILDGIGRPKPHAPPVTAANLITVAGVTMKAVAWLWPQRIALGKLTMIAGDPGLGKSFLTLDLAARVSRGAAWPDGTRGCDGGVVILSAEDDPEDTIRPRLEAAGGNLTRINLLRSVNVPSGNGTAQECSFSLQDLAPLEDAIEQTGRCRLVIIDPVSAYCGKADSHSNTEVRGLLGPLSDLAADKGVAVVAVSHLRKGEGKAMYRTMGSLAFVAAARAAFAVAADKDDRSRRLVLPVKSNIAADRTGLAYRLLPTVVDPEGLKIETAAVEWEPDPIEIDADDALGDGRRGQGGDALDEAVDWLASLLTDGPRPAGDVKKQAKADGISARTLDRAKKKLGVVARKESAFGGPWTWGLRLMGDAPPASGESDA